MPSGRAVVTGVLFNVAVDAAKNIKAPSRGGNQQAALVSIVFSVIALEAFLNEVTDVASDYSMYPLEPPTTAAFFEQMRDAEKSRISIESRFSFSNLVLAGKPVDRGAQPYQDFSLLVGLRNDLVHLKPSENVDIKISPEEIHKNLFRKFRAKNILATDLIESPFTPWTQLIATKAVAEWSCRTASPDGG
jgi:hypothetical protein